MLKQITLTIDTDDVSAVEDLDETCVDVAVNDINDDTVPTFIWISRDGASAPAETLKIKTLKAIKKNFEQVVHPDGRTGDEIFQGIYNEICEILEDKQSERN